jgi:hypothetical protein
MRFWKAILVMILAACTAQATPTATPAPPEFSMSVTDVGTGSTFTATNYTVAQEPESGVVRIDFTNGETGQIVQVFLEPDATPESVSLIESADAMNPRRDPQNGIWLLVQGADTSSGAEPVYYSKTPNGTVTLTTRGNILSGSVEVTLTNADGLPITVSGDFANLVI